ncbi:MAG TPA: hypothetical protein VG734_25640 [Lacunisphaera sp.]|nr:hypothetical protein [Lacunisphaera sp.]
MLCLPPEHIKLIENRDWGSTVRGPVWVHASKGMTKRDYEDACDFAVGVGVPHSLLPPMASLPRGGIVGHFTITDLILPGGKHIGKRGARREDLQPHPRAGDRWYMGGFGYVTEGNRPVPFVPCKGALGFWRVPDEVVRTLTGVDH